MKFKISYLFKNKKEEYENAELIYEARKDCWKITIENKDFQEILNKKSFINIKNFVNYCKINKITLHNFIEEEKTVAIYFNYKTNFISAGEQDRYVDSLNILSAIRFTINNKKAYLLLRNDGALKSNQNDVRTMELIDFQYKQFKQDRDSSFWEYINKIDKEYYSCSDKYTEFFSERIKDKDIKTIEERFEYVHKEIQKLENNQEKFLLLLTHYYCLALKNVTPYQKPSNNPKLVAFSALLEILKLDYEFYEKYIVFDKSDIELMEKEFGEVPEISFYKNYILNKKLNITLPNKNNKNKTSKI